MCAPRVVTRNIRWIVTSRPYDVNVTWRTEQPMTERGIHVADVRRSFSGVHALTAASLDAPAGVVTGLVGPNGSGKTTLMLILASLLRPDAGTVRIDGIDPVTDPRAARKVIGWMPDILGS